MRAEGQGREIATSLSPCPLVPLSPCPLVPLSPCPLHHSPFPIPMTSAILKAVTELATAEH